MAVDMPEPNARGNLHAPRQVEIRRLIDPLLEVLVVLTIDIIKCQCPVNSIGVVTEGLTQGVVHVHLPFWPTDESVHIWKVTISVGEPFPFLKVHHRMRDETAVSSTSIPSYPCDFQLVTGSICLVDR